MGTLAPMLVCVMAGCTSTGGFTAPWNKTAAKADAPKDNLILTGGRGLEREPIDPGLRQELDTAKRLMLDKKYAEAEKIYHKLMLPGLPSSWFDVMAPFTPTMSTEAKKKYPRSVFEEALFGEGECQRLQKNYRASMARWA